MCEKRLLREGKEGWVKNRKKPRSSSRSTIRCPCVRSLCLQMNDLHFTRSPNRMLRFLLYHVDISSSHSWLVSRDTEQEHATLVSPREVVLYSDEYFRTIRSIMRWLGFQCQIFWYSESSMSATLRASWRDQQPEVLDALHFLSEINQ